MNAAAENPSRIPELDGIRGIAILLVVIAHYLVLVMDPALPAAYYVGKLFGLAWSGVDFFFVLSGFLIGGILLDAKESNNFFKVFYTRRVCRIFPLYFTWLFLYLAIFKLLPSAVEKFPGLLEGPFPFWSYFTFTQNIYGGLAGHPGPRWLGPTWSLAVEEQFYLLLPFVIRFAPKRWLWMVILAIALMAPVWRMLIFFNFSKSVSAVYGLLPCRVDTLMIGVLCAMAVRNAKMKQWLEKSTPSLYVLFAVFLGGIILMTQSGVASLYSVDMTLYGYTLLALFYASVLLIAITEKRGLIKSIANFTPLRSLGIVAYGVYLFHEAVNGITFGLLYNREPQVTNLVEALVTLFSFSLTFVLAHLSWRFFEKPIVAVGHRLKYRRDGELLKAAEVIRPVDAGRFPENKVP